MSITFLSAKIGLLPPGKKAQNVGNCAQISRKSSKLTLFLRGGMHFYGQSNFADIWAFLTISDRNGFFETRHTHTSQAFKSLVFCGIAFRSQLHLVLSGAV